MAEYKGSKTKRRLNVLSDAPTGALPPEAPKDAHLLAFARRLQKAMLQKGYSQSDLAREATKHMPEGHEVRRDAVSKYISAKFFPDLVKRQALAKALGVDPDELIPPTNAIPSTGNMASLTNIRDMGDGTVWLRINEQVPWPTALKVLDMLKGEDEE